MDSYDQEAVGYGRPPKRTQFTKGQSGNPKGRPKGSGMRSVAEKVLGRTVPVTVDGVRRKVPITEALMMQLVQKALAGDGAARRDLLKIANQVSDAQAKAEDQGMEIIIRDVLDTYGCGDTLVALGVIAKDKQAFQYGIEPWVIEAALARGAILTDKQRAEMEAFTLVAKGKLAKRVERENR